jgi:5-methylcytosine-specific restriction protein A
MARNPKWSRDELILALELYFRVNPNHTSDSNPEIIKLSATLNQLPIHPAAKHGEKFRNANGVYMKLCNYLRFDPDYTGEGLKRGGKLEEEIWNEFTGDPKRLTEVATSILAGMTEVSAPTDSIQAALDEDEEFPEGRVLTQLHKRRERNRKVTKKKKSKMLEETGILACEVCGFDFQEVYGELGEGFAECHHRKPLSTLTKSKNTRLSDLAIVCANCHRMLHRTRPWKSVEELSKLVNG